MTADRAARISIVGEYDPSFVPHVKTDDALRHSAAALDVAVEATWVSTTDVTPAGLREADALLSRRAPRMYVPQLSSSEERPHPLINGFVSAAVTGRARRLGVTA